MDRPGTGKRYVAGLGGRTLPSGRSHRVANVPRTNKPWILRSITFRQTTPILLHRIFRQRRNSFRSQPMRRGLRLLGMILRPANLTAKRSLSMKRSESQAPPVEVVGAHSKRGEFSL